MWRRNLLPELEAALSESPIVFLQGARQVGKSTLVQRLPGRRYLTLDDATVYSAVSEDPEGFLSGLEEVTLDEVQRAPALARALKASVDRDRRPGRFLLTGSAGLMVLPRLADALVGRMETLTLHPLSQGELAGVSEGFVDAAFGGEISEPIEGLERAALVQRVLAGGYPEVLSRAEAARRVRWYDSYLSTLLSREVRDLSQVEDLAAFPRILAMIAARSSGLLNSSDLSNATGVSQTTLRRYLALLHGIFLVQTLPAWSSSPSRRLQKSPKLYVQDSGMMAWSLGLDEARVLETPDLFGPLLETFVVGELTRAAGWSQTRPQLTHLRTHQGQEVDVVMEDRAGRVVGVEIKARQTARSEDFAGLRVLGDLAGERFRLGVLLYGGREVVWFGERLVAAPISALWSPTPPPPRPAG